MRIPTAVILCIGLMAFVIGCDNSGKKPKESSQETVMQQKEHFNKLSNYFADGASINPEKFKPIIHYER
jgi:hypothetical protein